MDNENIIEIADYSLLPENPVVSVLMITYNHEKYVAHAINAILGQKTNFPFEIVIGEDCSTDKTREVIKKLQLMHPNLIRIIYSERNVGVNRNFARSYYACRGKYIALCEGDDYWTDCNKLSIQVGVLESCPKCVIAYHDAIYLSSLDSGEIKSLLNDKGKRGHSGRELSRYAYMPTLTWCFRRVIVEYPDEFYYVLNADTFIASMLGKYGDAVYLGEIAPSVYREHDGGIWSGLKMEDKLIKNSATFYWLSIYYKRIGDNSLSNHFMCSAIGIMLKAADIKRVHLLKCSFKIYFPWANSLYIKFKKFL